jgi:hypothetical protein
VIPIDPGHQLCGKLIDKPGLNRSHIPFEIERVGMPRQKKTASELVTSSPPLTRTSPLARAARIAATASRADSNTAASITAERTK